MPSSEEDLNAAFEKGRQQGFKEGVDYRRMFITIQDEVDMPLEWDGYTDEYEQEVIASIVAMPEYKMYFRPNMIRQGMLKWRQARLQQEHPDKMQLFNILGNTIIDLATFYDNAHVRDGSERAPEPGHGYDSIID